MKVIDPDREIKIIKYKLNGMDLMTQRIGGKASMLFYINFYADLQNYMNSHPEYYGCSE